MKKILVGLSGGVDSAVSALLLRDQGYDVSCGFMINYLDEENETCPTKIDIEEARRVALFLGLPFFTFDYREEYEKRIVEYIYREYAQGHTPNPDVFCNNLIKFDLFLEEAIALGYDGIATGHYARIAGGKLLKGVDPTKDQSYFLSRLLPSQIARSIFPIGNLLKSEVRTLAQEAHLPNADRKDSQGLCFIGKVSMKEFLEKRIEKKPGKILNTRGESIGEHEGAFSYTIGQRKGIKIGAEQALFVISKDVVNNTITVGNADELDLFSSSCRLIDWVGDPLVSDCHYTAKIRYRQEDQVISSFEKDDTGGITIFFKSPQRAIASGQICVVYDQDRVVGSGVILD